MNEEISMYSNIIASRLQQHLKVLLIKGLVHA